MANGYARLLRYFRWPSEAVETEPAGLSIGGRWYVRTVTFLGLCVVGVSLLDLQAGRVDPRWLWLAALTIISASTAIRVPTIPATISVSETFVFTSLLLFGTPAGTLTVAVDGLVASLWLHRRGRQKLHQTLFNVGAPALALWVSAHLFVEIAGIEPAVRQNAPIESLIAPLFLLAIVYFLLNGWTTALAIGFEKRISPLAVWRSHFLWLAINYYGGASVTVLLLLLYNTVEAKTVALGLIVPLLTTFYLMFKIAMGRVGDAVEHLTKLKEASEERALLLEQLREAQKMEAVGRLAAGVAHDFNNMLSPIIGYVEMLLEDLPPTSPHREELKQVQKAAGRAHELTRQLLAFGRRQMLSLKPQDLRSVVAGFEKLLRRTVREDIRIDVRMPAAVGMVEADAGQIEQVLMNLALNAQDAMPKGGVLTIELADVFVREGRLPGLPDITPGPYVRMTAGDTGVGMSEHVAEHVFEPFFTTKEQGRGTGLGLATVHGIVKQHGGYIKVDSTAGRGTTFTIFLPRTDMPDAADPAGSAREATPRAAGNILVAEDDEAVRVMTCRVLERQGYQVTAADGGQRCVEAAKSAALPYDLLLSDMVMPDVNGCDLYERLREIQPELKVIYMSGYPVDVMTSRGIQSDDVHFIQKPFTPHVLVSKVHEVLSANGRLA
ncbi:MAG: ATP-binding protein [Acidobacteriota bacterium]